MNSKKITGQQIRMARVALKWRVDDLSKYSELPWARLQKFERTDDFLPNANWNVEVLKDDEVSRFYYKVTYKTLQ